ncbi:uncharacterized protein LOC129766794 [Toxorhynchites rutilus septentrionalis]|uniref:uncharacterized protein LOC129766794 n=1 Tax=Toxorhynchites rutilus septentrionalis TaxID=329112 RepID=UPI00247980BD|nr:uncharacterized protein LOC129766794 [Toxorhynchites rutilus septentrionalis]
MPIQRSPKETQRSEEESGLFKGFPDEAAAKGSNIAADAATASQLNPLFRQRRQVFQKVIRIRDIVDNSDIPVNIAQLRLYSRKLPSLSEEFSNFHNRILAIIPDNEMETQEAECLQFEDVCDFTSTIVEDLLMQYNAPEIKSSAPSQVIIQQQPLKAPIPTFDGKYENWPRFKAMFQDIISRCSDCDAIKLHHLDKALIGAAAGIIDAKTLADNNYTHAWNLLVDRFENPRIIIDSHIGGLLNMKPMKKESHGELRELLDTCTRHVEGLKFMGQTIDVISGLIVVKIAGLLLFKRNSVKVHTATFDSNVILCQFCGEDHYNYLCPEFCKLSLPEKLQNVKDSRVCFNCLRRGHRIAECSSRKSCSVCKKRHHSLLHNDVKKSEENAVSCVRDNTSGPTAHSQQRRRETESTVSSSCSFGGSTILPNVLLLTAMVYLRGKNGKIVLCRAFLDSGAQTNLISMSKYNELGLEGIPVNIDIVGVSSARSKSNRLVEVSLMSTYNNYETELKCLVTPKITGTLPRSQIDIAKWNIPTNLHMADPQFHKPAEVDLLIGIGHFFKLLKGGYIYIAEGLPELRETELGWVVSREIQLGSYVSPQHVNSVTIESLDTIIKRFWEVEEIETEVNQSKEEQECEEFYRRTHKRDQTGRFIVKLPFREIVNQIDDNRSLALRRFMFLEKRLRKDPDIQQQYSDFIKEYESLEHCKEIREADDPPGKLRYYLPHHAVLRPMSSSTKLRVVFDASAKSPSGTSLNDVLQVGAVVQSDLLAILLRFRQYRFVFTADITKMYRQVLVDSNDTSFQRIFWRDQPADPLRVLELVTVTYGTSVAPYLATRSLVQLCEDEKELYPLASRIIKQDCYMDDMLSGANTLEDAVESKHQIQGLLQRGGFPVHKWCANNGTILEGIPEANREKVVQFDPEFANEGIKTLGLIWNPTSDEFRFMLQNCLIL